MIDSFLPPSLVLGSGFLGSGMRVEGFRVGIGGDG